MSLMFEFPLTRLGSLVVYWPLCPRGFPYPAAPQGTPVGAADYQLARDVGNARDQRAEVTTRSLRICHIGKGALPKRWFSGPLARIELPFVNEQRGRKRSDHRHAAIHIAAYRPGDIARLRARQDRAPPPRPPPRPHPPSAPPEPVSRIRARSAPRSASSVIAVVMNPGATQLTVMLRARHFRRQALFDIPTIPAFEAA